MRSRPNTGVNSLKKPLQTLSCALTIIALLPACSRKHSPSADDAGRQSGRTEPTVLAASRQKIVGRWELPDGREPLVFLADGTCKMNLADRMTPGTYTVLTNGQIEYLVTNSQIRLSGRYHFQGENLTDGVVFFGTGQRLWHRVGIR